MHPTDGELRAFLDREVEERRASRIRRHVRSCEDCRRRRDELLAAERVTREALGRLPSRPDAAAAREAVRRRLAARHDSGPAADGTATRARWHHPAGWSSLARAAALVLFVGTAFAAALPGSPVREWIGSVLERPAVEQPAPNGGGPSGTEPGAAAAAVRVEPLDGAVSIRLTGVEPGTSIRVVFVAGRSAGVEASGEVRFRSGPGFVEAAGIESGTLVEIPRDAASAEIRVNGRSFLRKDGEDVTLPTADPDTVGAELLFRVPDPGADRSP